MEITYESIDCDGDTWIMTRCPVKNSQHDGKLPTDGDQHYDEEASTEANNVDCLEAWNQEKESLCELRLRVSKKHLTVASPRAKAMFEGGYLEAQRSETDGFYHWRIESLFELEALKIVMKIIHTQVQDLPSHITLEMMVSIAEIVDDLQCHKALSFFANVWISRLSQPIPSRVSDDLVRWIFVAYVFGLGEQFKQATKVAIMHTGEPLKSLGLPIPPDIIDKIEVRRQNLLKEFVNQLHDLVDYLCQGYGCQNFACRSVILGALLQQMRKERLHAPRPTKPFVGSSLFSLLEVVRRFHSPVLYHQDESLLDGESAYVWVRQEKSDKDFFESFGRKKKHVVGSDYTEEASTSDAPYRLIAHLCSSQAMLKPLIDALEAKIEGMDLK